MGYWTKIAGLFQRGTHSAKFIGESKNGIKVFKTFTKDGKVLVESYKDGKLFKSVTKEHLCFKKDIDSRTFNGHRTVAVNHETGVTTRIEKGTNYFEQYPNRAYDTSFTPRGYGRFFSSESRNADDIMVGTSYNYVETPLEKFSSKVRRLDANSYIASGRTILGDRLNVKWVRAQNFKMPNGNVVTGRWEKHFVPKRGGGYSWEYGGFHPRSLGMEAKGDGTFLITEGFEKGWPQYYFKRFMKQNCG